MQLKGYLQFNTARLRATSLVRMDSINEGLPGGSARTQFRRGCPNRSARVWFGQQNRGTCSVYFTDRTRSVRTHGAALHQLVLSILLTRLDPGAVSFSLFLSLSESQSLSSSQYQSPFLFLSLSVRNSAVVDGIISPFPVNPSPAHLGPSHLTSVRSTTHQNIP